jgi:signal transduction histidine kinase
VQISRLIRKRLAPLHAGAKIVADGGLDHRINSDGSDEFAELALSINAMTDKLAAEITERRKSESEIIVAQNQLKATLNAIPDLMFELGLDGRYYDIHALNAELLAAPPELLLGKLVSEILPSSSADVILAALREAHEKGLSFGKQFELPLPHGNLWFELSAARTAVLPGQEPRFIVLSRDITERKQVEQELHDAKEQAEAATKLKDKFVSLVAHDLRSPFTSMMGLLRLFMDRKLLDMKEEEQKLLNAVFQSGERMLKMIDDLLKISRLQTGSIVPQPRFFKGHTAVAVTIGSISHIAAQKGIVIINDIPVDTRLYADQALFDEVLLNLLTNAIKFCSKGDRITFFIPPGLKSAIAVRDTGKGVDERIIPNLFRHEVKTTTVGTGGERGTGLGLPYSYDIIRAHGGEITVESAPGKGTVFCVMLPYVRPIALVVDDEPMALLIVRIHLEKIDIEVREALSGEQALAVITDTRPHIIITDINMPGMDGFALLDRLKKESATRDIPVIVMTSTDGAARETALRHGAADFVSKPIMVEDFIPRVRRFVG